MEWLFLFFGAVAIASLGGGSSDVVDLGPGPLDNGEDWTGTSSSEKIARQ
jgi:hypothetical protein